MERLLFDINAANQCFQFLDGTVIHAGYWARKVQQAVKAIARIDVMKLAFGSDPHDFDCTFVDHRDHNSVPPQLEEFPKILAICALRFDYIGGERSSIDFSNLELNRLAL